MFGKGQKLADVPGSVVRRLCNTLVVYWTMIRKGHQTKNGGKKRDSLTHRKAPLEVPGIA